MSGPTGGASAAPAERWRRALAVFDEVADLPADECEGRLAQACAGDPALRAEVLRLLAADTAEGAMLDRPASDLVAGLEAPPAEAEDLPEGAHVGPWRIEREIGRGGMGRVYLASRSDGSYEQRVALKRVSSGLDTAEVFARFRRERSILARLEHRGIARLVDGGVDSGGRPYFAMEYVDGEPVTRWCERNVATLRDVLLLFRQVCEAVRFAHGRLVVHRDLKPANVLVSAEGHVKLLDFGIAKIIDPSESDPGDPRTLDRRLTPHYASPEQVRGEPATTSADVWALGVLLYELLAGTRPFGRGAASLAEVQRDVLEGTPVPPSAAALARPAWRAKLPSDLDAIVMRALARNPDGRYASVEALLGDLDRFLDGRSVGAARATAAYRARKFVARNRAAVVATLVAILATAAAVVGLATQSARARAEATRAREMTAFVTGLFRAADPTVARGDTLTARVLLDQGVERVRHELADQPAVRADMLQELATIHAQLGAYDRAESLYTEAAALRARTAGPRSVARATSLAGVGAMRLERADYDGAEAALREALEVAGTRPAAAAPRAKALATLGGVWQARGRFAPADSAFRIALALDERLHGRDSPEVAEDLDRLAGLLLLRGETRQAAPLLERVVDLETRTLGRDHPATARSLERLADAVGYYGQFARAESLRLEAIAIRRRVLGPDHADLGVSLHDLAGLAIAERRLATADSAYTEAYRILSGALGPEHPRAAWTLNNHGFLDWRRGRPADALARLTAADAVLRRRFGPGHDRVLVNQAYRAEALLALGRVREAASLAEDAVTASTAGRGAGSPIAALALATLAEVRVAERRLAAAESLATRAVELRRSARASNPMVLCESLEQLGRIRRLRGEDAAGREAYLELLAVSRADFDLPAEMLWPEAVEGYGLLERRGGEPRRADSLLRAAARGAAAVYGPDDPRARRARAALAAR